MTPTLDQVPGTWTLWIRMKGETPVVTSTYTASFAGSPGASEGQVTVTTSGGTSYTGKWQEHGSGADENVMFQIQDPAGSGKEFHFTGYMVGLAMGGYIKGEIGPISTGPVFSPGSWAAHKTSD